MDSDPMEMVGEDQLPDAQTLASLNNEIHGGIEDPTGIPDLTKATYLYQALQMVQAQCGFVPLKTAADIEWCHAHISQLGDMVQEAYEKADYSALMRLKYIREQAGRPKPRARNTQPVIRSEPSLDSAAKRALQAVIHGWSAPFIGEHHVALASNIRNMYYGTSARSAYMGHAAVIQSSGSGKSRLVHEVAKEIFTIPFNIRDPKEHINNGAYPPTDTAVHNLLMEWASEYSGLALQSRFHGFLQVVFEEITKELRGMLASRSGDTKLPLEWHEYLTAHRGMLYSRVTALAKAKDGYISAEEQKSIADNPAADILKQAQDALETLVKLVCTSSGCSADGPTTVGGSSDFKKAPLATCDELRAAFRPETIRGDPKGRLKILHILMYFDEAHVLAEVPSRLAKASSTSATVPTSMDTMETDPTSTSTTDHSMDTTDTMDKMAVDTTSTGANQNNASEPSSPPEHKTALDILVSALDDCRDLGLFTLFMSTQSSLEHLAPSAIHARSARYSALAPSMHAPITETPFDCFGDNRLVPSKLHCKDLLCNDNMRMPIDSHTIAAQTAVLDVRIMLSFEPSREAAHRHEEQLVASHMRIAYSVPKDRIYLRSGYSSEPILAEAAARQLHEWRRQCLGLEPSATGLNVVDRLRDTTDIGPAVQILRKTFDHDLLSRGEVGEVIGRLLLMLARDSATCATSSDSDDPHFSNPVPVTTFIEQLLSESFAKDVLTSRPDNLPANAPRGDLTFAEAFKDAVVNFTHFAKWADDSALSQDTALGCFIRSMAVICRNNAATVDVFIPVLMNKDAALDASVMTGIMVQFKLRAHSGTIAAYAIDATKVGLFKQTPDDDETQRHPYITLIMELGVNSEPPLLASIPVKPESKESIAVNKKLGEKTPVSNAGAPLQDTPSKVVLTPPAPRRRRGSAYPRYSIYVYGCSPTVYRVISKNERGVYKHMLGGGKLLAEHPRQDPTSLRLVRMLKPFFAIGHTSWHWLCHTRLNTDLPDESDDEGGVVVSVGGEDGPDDDDDGDDFMD
ncbi:hypothetical protein ONZ51_g11381 [Trametes cubensis]|uniref:Uncharacterized protein n=1 Tax=Trametes cubensis TaxID=1111947 RepID=A0AAD7X7W9_9APHY|nr:hypothetical protein ONZ51_g11381 [Trametes cubensis]